MDDVLKMLQEAGFKPEVIEDDGGFEPVKGKYVCRIDSAGRQKGESKKDGKPYDFRAIKLQVAQIIDGDKATNRFLSINYNTDTEGMKRLLNDLFTAGIEIKAKSDEELDAELEKLVDRTMNVRAWVWTPEKDRDNNPIAPEDRVPRQMLKVVKEFGKSKSKPSSIKGDVPF